MCLNMRFVCRSLTLGHVGAILELSWEDLGATWGHVRAMLRHVGQSRENLGTTLVNLGLRNSRKLEIDDFTKVL